MRRRWQSRPGRVRATVVVGLLASVLLLAVSSAAGAAPVRSVESIGLTVSNLDAAAAFYTEVLDFEKLGETEVLGEAYESLQGVFGLRMRVATFLLGSERLELTQYLAPEGRPVPADSRSNDRWFQHVAIVVRDMDEAYGHLRRAGVRHASTGPQRLPDWNPDAGGIRAFYFKDADGHPLEIIWFPAGKGDPRWQQETDRLFLGIDHTAIVVADTDASLAFYGSLGFHVAGHSENWGPEQERLNNVFGARLRITALRAGAGPGIELLEYLAPRDGRPYPADARSNDLWHWQTTLGAGAALPDRLAAAGGSLVSPGTVTLPDDALGFRRGILLRDPDGHALRLVERVAAPLTPGTSSR